MLEQDIAKVAERLRAGVRITVLTGAGVSAASGVPTFRGPDGLWRRYRPEELATPQAFARDPHLVWEWYQWRRQVIAGCRPNRAHEVLAGWARRYPGFRLVTQNVDGLHERAETTDVLRLHGSIWEVRCSRRCAGAPPRWRDDTLAFAELPPRCAHCGSFLRPAVVWFGESLDPDVLEAAHRATSCDIFFSVGTSAVVYPAALLIPAARRAGAFVVEINPQITEASDDVDVCLQGPAEDMLDRLEDKLTRVCDID